MGIGRLVILSGPSGVGKDTVIDAWRAVDPRVERVIAYTTRKPRPKEVDGVDYHFVSVDEFQRMAGAGEFLEHKKVFENYYATPLKDMDALLAAGRVAVLKIDVQGALAVMPLRPDAITVFLLPPRIADLEERIRLRNADSPEDAARRLDQARNEISFVDRYQHLIVNKEIDQAAAQLVELTSR